MKAKKLALLITSGIIVSIISIGFISPANDDFIIVRTIESHPMANQAKVMIISNSDGTTESIKLESIAKDPENLVTNLQTETAKIKEILGKGFELEHLSGGGGADGIVYTYFFRKK